MNAPIFSIIFRFSINIRPNMIKMKFILNSIL